MINYGILSFDCLTMTSNIDLYNPTINIYENGFKSNLLNIDLQLSITESSTTTNSRRLNNLPTINNSIPLSLDKCHPIIIHFKGVVRANCIV